MNNSKRSYYSNYSNEFLKDSNEEILGKKAAQNIVEGKLLSVDMFK